MYAEQLAPLYKCYFHPHISFSESYIFLFWLGKIYLK